jgi:hypothetical protein
MDADEYRERKQVVLNSKQDQSLDDFISVHPRSSAARSTNHEANKDARQESSMAVAVAVRLRGLAARAD